MNPAMSQTETGRASSQSSEVTTLSAGGNQLISMTGTLWHLNSNQYTIVPIHAAPSLSICFLGGFAHTIDSPPQQKTWLYPGVYHIIHGGGSVRRFKCTWKKKIHIFKNYAKRLNFLYSNGSSCANIMGKNQRHALTWKYGSDHQRWTQFPLIGASNHLRGSSKASSSHITLIYYAMVPHTLVNTHLMQFRITQATHTTKWLLSRFLRIIATPQERSKNQQIDNPKNVIYATYIRYKAERAENQRVSNEATRFTQYLPEKYGVSVRLSFNRFSFELQRSKALRRELHRGRIGDFIFARGWFLLHRLGGGSNNIGWIHRSIILRQRQLNPA